MAFKGPFLHKFYDFMIHKEIWWCRGLPCCGVAPNPIITGFASCRGTIFWPLLEHCTKIRVSVCMLRAKKM